MLDENKNEKEREKRGDIRAQPVQSLHAALFPFFCFLSISRIYTSGHLDHIQSRKL